MPKRPLFQGGYGAVEVAARVEKLTFDSVATGEAPSTSSRADVILGNSNQVRDVRRELVRQPLGQDSVQRHPGDAGGPGTGSGCRIAPRFWSRILRFQFQL